MNAGTENRTKLIVAIALGAIAVVLIATQAGGWFSSTSSSAATQAVAHPADTAADPIPAPKQTARGRTPGKAEAAAIRSMDPSLRFDLLRVSEDTKYEGTGRNIFRVFVEPPPRILKSPVLDQHPVVAQGPPPTPPPPQINLVFYGFATPQSGAKRIFLAQGEDVFIAKEGDIVDRRYKVVRISANAVEILDVLSNNRQSIPLTQG